MLDLRVPEHSYYYGFMTADGNLYSGTRNRGKASLEIRDIDHEILSKFKELFPIGKLTERTRDTNFAKNVKYVKFTVHNLAFRERLKECGYLDSNKTFEISHPLVECTQKDYLRGLIDGDGSLGFTDKGIPFLSLCTVNENTKNFFIEKILEITGFSKTTSRNKRDNAYNISIYRDNAKMMSNYLYYDGCLSLSRKLEKARLLEDWTRPSHYRKRTIARWWSPREDEIVRANSNEEAMKILCRSRKSVMTRRYRLKTNKQRNIQILRQTYEKSINRPKSTN